MHAHRLTEWIRSQAPAAALGDQPEAPSVLDFGDPTAEYTSLTERVALLPTPGWAQILAEGPDTLDYLHRRLTQAIRPLGLGEGAHALLLGGDGRMQADLLVWRGDEAAMILTPRPEAEKLFDLLDRYILMDRLELTRFWLNEPLVALAGPHAPRMLAALMDPRPAPGLLEGIGWHGWFTVNVAGLPCRVFSDGRHRVPLFHISVPPMALAQMLGTLLGACREAGGGLAGTRAYELMRIESGVTRFGAETAEGMIPLEAGLSGAISFDKGCYPGQEILARIRNLGHPARVLMRATLQGEHALEPGAAVEAGGAEPGALASAATLPGLGRTEALVAMPWGGRESTEGSVAVGEVRIAARLHPLREGSNEQTGQQGGRP